jgi:outer membrane protein OmpA-like peptidoglycan-associated protein
MNRRALMALAASAASACALPLLAPAAAFAQPATPGVEDMVRALTPQARTRSLAGSTRNLQPMLDLTIHFDFDSANIRAESKKPLQDLAQALQDGRLSSFRFQVEGHTDAQGTAAYNDSLSERRAQAVVGFLSAEGVGTKRLQPVGKGFRELLDTADPKSAKNRRVRILTQP